MKDLGSIKLFAGLPQKELDQIRAQWNEVDQPAGREIMKEGSKGAGFLVILDGEAEVHLGGGRTRTLEPGDFYGEMAFIEELPRSHTIVAKTDMKLLGIARWDFKHFLAEHPEIAWRLLQTLSHRLREAEAGQPA